MDEGSGFFDDLKKKESKHESDLSLLNQLYDGKGDKTTLAQNKEDLYQEMLLQSALAYSKKPI